MRKIILTITFLALYVNSYAIDGWMAYQTFINTAFLDITFVNSSTGWAVGNTGVIIKTTNGGNSWFQQNSDTDRNLFSVSFIDENTGWAGGGDVNLFTFSHVFLVGTTNGGSSWDTLFDNHLLNTHLKKVYLQNSMGFILGEGGNGGGTEGFLFKTTNFGINWTSNPPSDFKNYWDIVFKDNNTGWMLTKYASDIGYDTATVWKTTNGGVLWNRIYSRERLNLYSIHYFGGDNILVYGQSFMPGTQPRLILKSGNGGVDWDSANSSSSGSFWSSSFVNPLTGWAAGTSGIIKTTNGGESFTQQLNVNVNALFMQDSVIGWGAASNGYIVRTITGGITGIAPTNNSTPEKFGLNQNYPNPFNPSTLIKFDISKSGNARISIYDNTGRLVETIINQTLSPGTYEVQWNANSNPSGVYFYRLETEEFSQTKKMLLIK